MDLIADILLGAGALGAAIYCMVLSRRLQKLTQLESGMGGAIAVLSAQVDDLTRTLGRAESAAKEQAGALEAKTRRAEEAVKRLELLISSLHDLPTPAPPGAGPAAAADSAPVAAAAKPAPKPATNPASKPAGRTRVVRRRSSRRVEEDA